MLLLYLQSSGVHVKGLMLICFLQGTKIVDESHDQDTTDLHKCVAYMRDLSPNTDKSAVSWMSGYTFYFLFFFWREEVRSGLMSILTGA